MSIWSVLLEALRNEEHSELIGDEVAIRRMPQAQPAISMDKRKLNKLLGLLQNSEEKALTKAELKTLIQLMREYTLVLQKREHMLMVKEIAKLHSK